MKATTVLLILAALLALSMVHGISHKDAQKDKIRMRSKKGFFKLPSFFGKKKSDKKVIEKPKEVAQPEPSSDKEVHQTEEIVEISQDENPSDVQAPIHPAPKDTPSTLDWCTGKTDSPDLTPADYVTNIPDSKDVRIIAIGDIHGEGSHDSKRVLDSKLRRILEASGLATFGDNEWEPTWTGGDNNYLVQTGDMVDRGLDDVHVWKMLINLQQQKPTNVHLNLGNHELLLMKGDFRYTKVFAKNGNQMASLPDDVNSSPDKVKFENNMDFFACKCGVAQSIKTLPMIRIVGGYMFMHGGLTKYWADKAKAESKSDKPSDWLRYLNGLAKTSLHDCCLSKDQKTLANAATCAKDAVFESNGQYAPESSPLWYRGFSFSSEKGVPDKTASEPLNFGKSKVKPADYKDGSGKELKTVGDELKYVNTMFGVKAQVLGHSIHPRVQSFPGSECGSINIDCGMFGVDYACYLELKHGEKPRWVKIDLKENESKTPIDPKAATSIYAHGPFDLEQCDAHTVAFPTIN